MGKQINFYMDSEIEAAFISKVFETYTVLDWNIKEYHNAQELNRNIDTFYLYKQKYGEIYINSAGEKNLDILKSPVIEFVPNQIIKERKIVLRGRLWMDIDTTEFFSKEIQLEFVKDYEKLVRWIKRNVPYQKYFNVKDYYKIYINENMKKLGEQGYHFMA